MPVLSVTKKPEIAMYFTVSVKATAFAWGVIFCIAHLKYRNSGMDRKSVCLNLAQIPYQIVNTGISAINQ